VAVSPYTPSKWLIQACPPDLTESRADARWTFGVYEVLDRRETPVKPSVLHVIYRGAVELQAKELPERDDPFFSGKLEEAVVAKWKRLAY